MTDTQLLTTIQANPTALAQATTGNDAGCAATITATLPMVVGSLPNSALLVWAATRGVRAAIKAGTTNSNQQIASACLAVEDSLGGGAMQLDLTNPLIGGTGGLLDGLTAAGILPANTAATGQPPTPGSKADLLVFGSVASPAIDPGQVSRVWFQFRPGGIVGGSN